ncbi:MAG: type II toxin-antitoxin system VapC family toxin [Terracidiphilus sp.]
MKIIADTNLLVRLAVDDDPHQRRVAARTVSEADAVIVGRHTLCEMAWVLRSKYRLSKEEIMQAIGNLCGIGNVAVDRTAVEAGLAAMQAGADFADGVIAYEGRWLGGETFVSFDKKAVSAIEKQGQRVKLLG